MQKKNTKTLNAVMTLVVAFDRWFTVPYCGGLMVSALDSESSGPGSGPGRGHCVVFLGKTLYSHGASLHPGV